jgi:2-keto-4-pentenoate hydratase
MDLQRTADELLDMRRTKRVIADLAADMVPPDFATAYAIQDQVVAGLLGDGGSDAASGYKCACTSEIAQAALQIDRPVFGQLLPHTTTTSGSTLDTDGFTHRVIEAEFGFRLGRDVIAGTGPHTRESIADYIDAVLPSIEIVDYRYESWNVGALQVAADNAIHGWWVHSEPVEDWRGLDLESTAVSVSRNGETVTTGSGANVLGHPLTVMAWLADELIAHGRHLQAGDMVTTGVTTDVFEAESGDHIVADFAGIGTTEVHFS